MDAPLVPLLERIPVRGNELSLRVWPGVKQPFLLVHGLASNARTWDGVARHLQAAGHAAYAVDQRGHGLSDKPPTGFGFDDITADLRALIEALGLERPIVAGQSWGGNVVLDFAACYPESLSGLVLVDGGFIDLAGRPNATWETTSAAMTPPHLIGTPRTDLVQRMRGFYPDLDEDAIEMQMANFETLDDGTIRPWLSLERHMEILRSIWEQRPVELYGHIRTPTLIAVADRDSPERIARKAVEVAAAEKGIERVRVRWFEDSVHDIHVQRPRQLAEWMLAALDDGFFG